jgi:type VI protein secretion system component Hcp
MRSANRMNRLAALVNVALVTAPVLCPGLAAAAPAPVVESGTGGENARTIGRVTGGAFTTTASVRSFRWGASLVLAGPIGSGGGVGKAVFADLTFAKAIDSNSPGLMGAVGSGLHSPTMSLEIFAAGSTNVLIRYDLRDVLVVGVTTGDRGRSNGGQPIEEVSVTYARIQTTVGAVTVCHDVARNAPC